MKKFAMWCAKIALNYLPDVAVWAIEQATDKAKDSEKVMHLLPIIEQIGKDASALANAMQDGKITDVEKEQIHMRACVLAEDLESLL